VFRVTKKVGSGFDRGRAALVAKRSCPSSKA